MIFLLLACILMIPLATKKQHAQFLLPSALIPYFVEDVGFHYEEGKEWSIKMKRKETSHLEKR